MNPQALSALITLDQAGIEKEMALLEKTLAVSAQDMLSLSPILD